MGGACAYGKAHHMTIWDFYGRLCIVYDVSYCGLLSLLNGWEPVKFQLAGDEWNLPSSQLCVSCPPAVAIICLTEITCVRLPKLTVEQVQSYQRKRKDQSQRPVTTRLKIPVEKGLSSHFLFITICLAR